MPDAINLLPQEERQEQVKEQLVTVSTVIAIILLVVVGVISGYFFYQVLQINKQTDAVNASIAKSRANIASLSGIELIARNLDARYKGLDSFFTNRVNYSALFAELAKRLPQAVAIESLSTGTANTLNISGISTDYISIAKFINNLRDVKFASSGPGLGALFTDALLNTVNLEDSTKRAKFFVVVTYNPLLLKDK